MKLFSLKKFSLFSRSSQTNVQIGEIVEDRLLTWELKTTSKIPLLTDDVDLKEGEKRSFRSLLLPSNQILFRVNLFLSSEWEQEGVLLLEKEIKETLKMSLTEIYFEYTPLSCGERVFVYWFVVRRSIWNKWMSCVSLGKETQIYLSPFVLNQFFLSQDVLEDNKPALFLSIDSMESTVLFYSEGLLVGIEVLRIGSQAFQEIIVEQLSLDDNLALKVLNRGPIEEMSHIASYQERYQESVDIFLNRLTSCLSRSIFLYFNVRSIDLEQLYFTTLSFYCEPFLEVIQSRLNLPCHEVSCEGLSTSSSLIVRLITQEPTVRFSLLPKKMSLSSSVDTSSVDVSLPEKTEGHKVFSFICGCVVLFLLMILIVDWAQYREKRAVITDEITQSEQALFELKQEDQKLRELLRYFQQKWEDYYYFDLLGESLPLNVVLIKVTASFQGYMDISGWAEDYNAIEKLMGFFVERKSFVSLLQVNKISEGGDSYFDFTLRIWN